MGKFIELHNGGIPLLLNTEHVVTVVNLDDDSATIVLGTSDKLLDVDETYMQVRNMIATAQGGIPMGSSKTVEGAPG